jgi:hypothetical protein
MKNNLKKTIAASLAAVCVFSFSSVSIAAEDYTVEDAYYEFCNSYMDFVDNVKAQDKNLTDERIISFVQNVYDNLLKYDDIDRDNFDDYATDAVMAAFSLTKNVAIRNAIMQAYPDATVDAMDGIVNPEFRPLYTMVKNLIFEHGMLGDNETEENTTEATTEAATEKVTEAPTEEPTEASTEAPTQAPTEAETEKATSSSSTGGSSGGTSSGKDDQDESTDETTTEATTEATIKFSDMSNAAWAEDAVNSLVKMGIIAGYPDGTFRPDNSITRAEFAKIIVLAAGGYDKDATAEFTDVKSSDWYYSYVASAKKLGLVAGRDDGSFDPNANITRGDVCTIVYRYMKTVKPQFGTGWTNATFADFSSIPSYAQEPVSALASAGIATALKDNKFEATTNATRAQSAQIVYGAIKAIFG